MKIKQYLKSNFKKFQKYFLEFLMLFLAVFLGFFADNLRDNYAEKKIEKEYVKSLVNDIKVDQRNIQQTIELNEYRINRLDSLSNLCFSYNEHKNDGELYKQYQIVNGQPYFFMPNEQTLSQLNYSGGLRLITSRDVVKEILKYDHRKEELLKQQEYYENFHIDAANLGLRLFNLYPFKKKKSYRKQTGLIWDKPFSNKLLISDSTLIKEFANKIYIYQSTIEYYNIMLRDTEKRADSLLIKLEQDYK